MTLNKEHNTFMHRCLQLALQGWEYTSPNPMVGCVIVCDGKIISEGYHQRYGSHHAEVMAINKLKEKELLKRSTLYVNLEPCSHRGKTPACALRIIQENIPHVVIGTRDPFLKVSGGGIKILEEAGVKVEEGFLITQCLELNAGFFNSIINKRPKIILKWAQNNYGLMGRNDGKRYSITNHWSNKFTHRIRATSDAIMIGRNTLINDNPQLSTRFYKGKDSRPIIFLREEDQTKNIKLFENDKCIRIFKDKEKNTYPDLFKLLSELLNENINTVLIEGGKQLLDSFISFNLWDEAYLLEGENNKLKEGVSAPAVGEKFLVEILPISWR